MKDQTCNQFATEYITKQAALDAISCDITITGRRNAELVAETIGTFVDRIKALPPAGPKRGKWIESSGQKILMQKMISDGEVWRVCSECGAGHMIGHQYEFQKAYIETHHNFCPRCGADMREGE